MRVAARRCGLADGVGVLRGAWARRAVDAPRVSAIGMRPAGLLRLRAILGRVVGVHGNRAGWVNGTDRTGAQSAGTPHAEARNTAAGDARF